MPIPKDDDVFSSDNKIVDKQFDYNGSKIEKMVAVLCFTVLIIKFSNSKQKGQKVKKNYTFPGKFLYVVKCSVLEKKKTSDKVRKKTLKSNQIFHFFQKKGKKNKIEEEAMEVEENKVETVFENMKLMIPNNSDDNQNGKPQIVTFLYFHITNQSNKNIFYRVWMQKWGQIGRTIGIFLHYHQFPHSKQKVYR